MWELNKTKLCPCSDWPYIAAEQIVLRQPLHARHLRFPAFCDSNTYNAFCDSNTYNAFCDSNTYKTGTWIS